MSVYPCLYLHTRNCLFSLKLAFHHSSYRVPCVDWWGGAGKVRAGGVRVGGESWCQGGLLNATALQKSLGAGAADKTFSGL